MTSWLAVLIVLAATWLCGWIIRAELRHRRIKRRLPEMPRVIRRRAF